MGNMKQKQIQSWEQEMTSEQDQFDAEEQSYKEDRLEMEEELARDRYTATQELHLALLNITEWQATRKYSSECITDAQERVSNVLGMIYSNKLWGN